MKPDRRQVLKILGAAPVAAAAQTHAGHPAAQQTPAPQAEAPGYAPKFFTAQEWRAVRVLADLVIPADERSGSATDAGVPEFMDELLSVRGGTAAVQVRGGLVWLDLQANRLFEHDFADCAPEQQKQLLDRIAYPKKAAPEDSQAVAFFNRFRDLVAGGFYTSKMGIEDLGYLGNQVVERWDGCPAEALKKVQATD